MIRHICMFTMKEEDKEAHIVEFMERAEVLCRLPMVKNPQVVRNVPNTPDNNYDVALVFDFDTVDDLDAYRVSPEHVAFGKFVGAVRENRACIDHAF